MNAVKIMFSPEEMRLVMDADVILTKNSAMGKVVELMAGLSEEYRVVWEAAGGQLGGAAGEPKISRGENYRGLPWVMLDYPRLFGRDDVFAIRTLFWWGHSFSVTLHLKGRYKERFGPVVRGRWAELAAAGFHVGVSEDEWRHEHVPENYAVVSGAEDMEREADFLKLSAAVGLDRWEHAPEELVRMFRTLIDVLFLANRA